MFSNIFHEFKMYVEIDFFHVYEIAIHQTTELWFEYTGGSSLLVENSCNWISFEAKKIVHE